MLDLYDVCDDRRAELREDKVDKEIRMEEQH